MKPPVIKLLGIGKRFGSDPPVDALKHVDLEVQRGEWMAVMGPSGSGKSTLLNVIGCLDVPTSGMYEFAGIDVGSLPDRNRAGLRARGIGFVFQSFHLLAHRSVVENVAISEVYCSAGRSGRSDRALAALDKVGMGHRSAFLPTRLSGGERQRVAIARSLVGSPHLLLCDEPTGNLDSQTTTMVLDILQTLHRDGMTIVMITHERDVAAAAPRRVMIIDGEMTEERQ